MRCLSWTTLVDVGEGIGRGRSGWEVVKRMMRWSGGENELAMLLINCILDVESPYMRLAKATHCWMSFSVMFE